MKTENRKVEEAGALVPSEACKKRKTGDARGRPRGRSSFLGDPDAKFFGKFVENDRRSRGGGKSGNPAAVAGFPSAVEKSCFS